MKIEYKPEIDGLRALAVGSIIIYHADLSIFNFKILSGGFIGVDIFFVISGYLISSIIFKEYLLTDNFLFSKFYKRRIKRILPVLIFVIFISLVFSWMYLLPRDLIDYVKSILYSLFFSSNYYFYFSGLEYRDYESIFKPFLHTWSLSIEEQYYVFFPILIFILIKNKKKFLILFLFSLFLLSLISAEYFSKNNASLSFFFLHTRLWELLSGSFLAYYNIFYELKKKINFKIINSLLPFTGFAMIGYSLIFFNQETYHPSLVTLFPVLGTCMIIQFANPKEVVTKILSSKIFVFFGLISYSLYLWHYPIFSFARTIAYVQDDYLNMIYIALLTLGLSIFTYFFVEKPFRRNKYSFKSVIIFISSFFIVIIIYSFYVIQKGGKVNSTNIKLEDTISSPIFDSNCKFLSNNPEIFKDTAFIEKFEKCYNTNRQFILIIGDSHALDFFNAISPFAKEDEFIVGLSKGWCRPGNGNPNCQYLDALKLISQYSSDIKHIFFTHKGSFFLTNIGSNKAIDFDNPNLRKLPLDMNQINNTFDYLKNILNLNNNLTFVGPKIEPRIKLDRKAIMKINNGEKIVDNSNYDLIYVDEKLTEISKNLGIEYISIINSVNFDFENDFIIDSKLTYSDTNHWNNFGEYYFGKKLIDNSTLKKILFK